MNGDGNNMFVEITWTNGEMVRALQPLEHYDAEYRPEFGKWDAPFTNDTFAFGLIEGMEQDDDYSSLFYRKDPAAKVSRVRTWIDAPSPDPDDNTMQNLLTALIRRKRREHYQRAVDQGIINPEQRTQMIALFEREVQELQEREAQNG